MEQLLNIDSKEIVSVHETPHASIGSDGVRVRLNSWPISQSQIEMHGDIGYFKGVLDQETTQYIINTCQERISWSKSVTVGESHGLVDSKSSPRQSSVIGISGSPVLREIDTFIHKTFMQVVTEYRNIYSMYTEDLGITQDEGYGLLRYEKGGYYRVHIDYTSAGQKPHIRALSGLIYLNDDYVGGEIFFPRQNIKIKPEAGSVVLFPGIYTHPHTSLDIESGIKYCIVTWWK